MWSRDRAVINFGNCAPQKSCKRHSLLHASLQLVTFQYWTSAKKKKIDLERPQTSADQRNIEELCSERKMEKRRLPTHNRYLWGNSFVYSLKTTHCFFHLQRCNRHCLCSFRSDFLLFALSITLSLFVERTEAQNNGKLIFGFDVSSAPAFVSFNNIKSEIFCAFLFCE